MSQWEAVIGLEVHAQLRTRTKIFCRCDTTFGGEPNTRTCPVCLGLPGALPVLNEEAVRMAVLAGLATHCTIQPRSLFARKNYFYPDLPKGYQISQGAEPVCTDGWLEVDGKCPRIQRIHLEEDAGKSMHGEGATLVDLNRAGTPLVEIVGHPDLRSPGEAVAYLRELRAILVYLGVCDGNMEEGSLRCDANVSVRPEGEARLGTRCEIKNINSFRGVRDAIAYEIGRQVRLIEGGERVVQQTRLWSQDLGRTEAMRSKEEAQDYRYFPDPDLLPLLLPPRFLEAVAATLPELPAQKRTRLAALGLPPALAAALCEEPARVATFERGLDSGRDAVAWANFLMTQVMAALNRSQRTWPDVDVALQQLTKVCDRWRAGQLTNKMLTDLLTAAFSAPDALDVALQHGLDAAGGVVTDTAALATAVDAVLARLPEQVAKYRQGQVQLLGFFVGQVMRELHGKGDVKVVGEILRQHLLA